MSNTVYSRYHSSKIDVDKSIINLTAHSDVLISPSNNEITNKYITSQTHMCGLDNFKK